MFLLEITEAHHDDNEFYPLGRIEYPTQVAQREAFMRLPRVDHICTTAERCYIVDALAPNGRSVEADREISEETARALLGVDLDALRAEARTHLTDLGGPITLTSTILRRIS